MSTFDRLKKHKLLIWKSLPNLGLLVLLLLLVLLAGPVRAQEPWPPFWFNLTPTPQDGKIRYELAVYSRVDRQMPDLTIKIPLPAGTRFVAAYPESGVEATFDGREITFFTSAFDRYIENSAFVVERTEPGQLLFTTQAWLSWKGSLPGDYLSEPISIDISRQPLEWTDPSRSRLQLGVGAAVSEETIVYRIYPRADDQYRMLDLQISFPLPPGTDLLHFSAPPSFAAGLDGQEILFSTLELARQTEIEPLIVELSTVAVTDSTLTTEIIGRWKNGPRTPIPGAPTNPVRNNGQYVAAPAPPTEEIISLDIAVSQPHRPQSLVFDMEGDAPLANYDLTSLAFQEGDGQTTVSFTTAGELGPVGTPLQFSFFLDRDCKLETGRARMHRGADFRISYDHEKGRANMVPWAASQADWDWTRFTLMDSLAVGNRVMISIPHNLVGVDGHFCWMSWAANGTDRYYPEPPNDWLPNGEHSELTRYGILPPAAPRLGGKLAVPIQNEQGHFDTHIFLLPAGLEIDRISQAHQPHFRLDGQRLVLNGARSRTENVLEHTYQDGRTARFVLKDFDVKAGLFEYDLVDQTELPLSSAGDEALPFYNPQGNQNETTDIPADTKGTLLTFTSFRDGNWEAYAINLDGTGLRNLSASPGSRDGLPTISPDGAWVAFLSDRDGRWAVWVVPSPGGLAQKLFDLPAELPFGENDSSWINERISWGP